MHISKYQSLIVHVADSRSQLPENGHNLVQVEWSLAKRLPGRDVIRAFATYFQKTILNMAVQVLNGTRDVQ